MGGKERQAEGNSERKERAADSTAGPSGDGGSDEGEVKGDNQKATVASFHPGVKPLDVFTSVSSLCCAAQHNK